MFRVLPQVSRTRIDPSDASRGPIKNWKTQSGFQVGWWVGLVLLCVCPQLGQAEPNQSTWERYRESSSHMGTQWHVTLYAQNAQTANDAFRRAFAVIGQLDEELSNFRPDSELNQLCRSSPHAQPVPVGKALWEVMQAADALSRQTDGAFDVTVGPLSRLWRRARQQHLLPDPDRIDEAKKSVGYSAIRYFPAQHSLQLTLPEMQIDLGAIAKGYAVDRALAVLRELGIERAMVNGGGGLGISLAPPGSPGWEVQLADIDPRKGPTALHLTNRGVATSGDTHQFLEINGKRYSHIIDPRTGIGLTRRSLVTVIAPTGILADAWATALSVLEPEVGMEMLQAHPEIQARILAIDADGKTVQYGADFE